MKKEDIKPYVGFTTRYLPFDDLRDLHHKCSAILSAMDTQQARNKKQMDDNGISYKELSPIGFSVDYNKPENKNIEEIFWALPDGKTMFNHFIEDILEKEGVLTLDQLPLNTKLL